MSVSDARYGARRCKRVAELTRARFSLGRLAAATVLLAVGLSVGPTQPAGGSARGSVADQASSAPSTTMPFDAIPPTTPLTARVIQRLASAQALATPVAALVPLPQNRVVPVPAAAIPRPVLAAYVNAARLTATSDRECRLAWQVLAGIGLVESDNAVSGGSASPHWDGVANPPIYGPVLDGNGGVARVPDTDRGTYDGDRRWDRAVGPMQILPSTWAYYGADGNHDGMRNPQDIDDATLAAAHYLCAAASSLNRPPNLIRAVYTYNHSHIYVRSVLTAIAAYRHINPAKLGINGLPKRRRRLIPMQIVPPSQPTGIPPTNPTPPASPAPPQPIPSPTLSARPTPTPSPSLPTKLPHHH